MLNISVDLTVHWLPTPAGLSSYVTYYQEAPLRCHFLRVNNNVILAKKLRRLNRLKN
jgi:hypothetical protein